MLTEDQRWLLRAVGGWAMVDCLIGPEGVTHLMQSMQSSTGNKRPGMSHYIDGYYCGRGKIATPWREDPRVIVTAAQINRYARGLPEELKAELREHAWRRNTNRYRGYQHCFCQSTPCGYGYLKDKFHPTDEQVRDHAEEWDRLRCWENSLLDRALDIAQIDEPVGQLELFEVSARPRPRQPTPPSLSTRSRASAVAHARAAAEWSTNPEMWSPSTETKSVA